MRGTRARYIPASRGILGRISNFDRPDFEAAIRRGISMCLSDSKVGEYAGVSGRTVLRYRKAHGTPPTQ